MLYSPSSILAVDLTHDELLMYWEAMTKWSLRAAVEKVERTMVRWLFKAVEPTIADWDMVGGFHEGDYVSDRYNIYLVKKHGFIQGVSMRAVLDTDPWMIAEYGPVERANGRYYYLLYSPTGDKRE